MLVEIHPIIKIYESFKIIHNTMRKKLGRDLTLTEKILYSHLDNYENININRGETDLNLRPDRIAMQDATAQMAILQFMIANMNKTAVPVTVHCDHLIQAENGADEDLINALDINKEVYDFLRTASSKYGMGFWKPGSGIIHQVVLENYAIPGMLMIGTDSHTPNAGGLGMIAIGVGGADAVDVMTNQPFGLKMPKLVGINLKGKPSAWTSPKDVIVKVAEIMTVKGGTGKILEYFGKGTKYISCTGKATITNMGAEIGATTSLFPYDESMAIYLENTDRKQIAQLTRKYQKYLMADENIEKNPDKYFDEIYEIDLSKLEPHIAGPHSPDSVTSISNLAKKIKNLNLPEKLSVGLIGSCTNSSYQDLSRTVNLVRQALKVGLKIKSQFFITPGSERIYETIKRDGILKDFEKAGGIILANACGPCIGQWKRNGKEINSINNIISSFNRNFKKRNDGNSNTNSFVASPEMVVAISFAGNMTFNPLVDNIITKKGKNFKFTPPIGDELPNNGFLSKDNGYIKPSTENKIIIKSNSDRLSLLTPFDKPNLNKNFKNMPILVKALGKCTTDHISPAGTWLKYRGHLDNISNNMYLGAINEFNQQVGKGYNIFTNKIKKFSEIARDYKKKNINWIVIADENYGEGSSREHAAMEPRHLGCRIIIARSFARIAEANLKKQGILPLWFINKSDYNIFLERDKITILNLKNIKKNQFIKVKINHENGSKEIIKTKHSLNNLQISWFKLGSALNYLRINSK